MPFAESALLAPEIATADILMLLLMGGSGDRVLRIAAQTAGIVGIKVSSRSRDSPMLFRLCTAAAAAERNDWYLAVVPGRA